MFSARETAYRKDLRVAKHMAQKRKKLNVDACGWNRESQGKLVQDDGEGQTEANVIGPCRPIAQ